MSIKEKLGWKVVLVSVLVLITASAGVYVYQTDESNVEQATVDDGVNNSETDASPSSDEGDEETSSQEVDYSVDCPNEVMNHCDSLSKEYQGDVSFKYKAQYTGQEGAAYYVQLKSDSAVADTGNKTVTIKFDGESGRVWDIG